MNAVARALARLEGVEADMLLVTTPANVRYLSGFSSPDDGVVLLAPERAVLLTDGRYTAQAAAESRLETDITSDWLARAAELTGDAHLAIESEHLTVRQFRRLTEALGREPEATRDLVTPLRLVKSGEELALLREAARITDAAFEHVLGVMRVGMRESEVALDLERSMRLQGADGAGFGIIVASGLRSAMPHGEASNKELEEGDLVTIDFGARYRGYHADMTRAVAIGAVSDRLRALFDAVLGAQEAALAAVAPGRSGRELDAIAREALREQDLAEAFSHSLGHGTGLEIHEGPRLSQRSDDVLEPGMTVTIEPGVYLPEVGGVRIEDLAVVTEDGHEVLSRSPKTFRQV